MMNSESVSWVCGCRSHKLPAGVGKSEWDRCIWRNIVLQSGDVTSATLEITYLTEVSVFR